MPTAPLSPESSPMTPYNSPDPFRTPLTRRQALLAAGGAAALAALPAPRSVQAAKRDPKWEAAMDKGLKWVAKAQSNQGHWTAGGYPTAMTALAGTALIGSGSTTTQGPYAKHI